jgi:non-lysosomal glucosylceramidase
MEFFASTIDLRDGESYRDAMSDRPAERKVAGSLPHDVGCPGNAPFAKLNSYVLHDTSHWKDLNVKFVLQVYRDYVVSKDAAFLTRMWPYCRRAMEQPISQDTDDDGVIDNDGSADQTYDAWPVKGASAYCGGLYLAGLQVMVSMAETQHDAAAGQYYSTLLGRGKSSYVDKLWNGKYLNFDSDKSEATHTNIHAD